MEQKNSEKNIASLMESLVLCNYLLFIFFITVLFKLFFLINYIMTDPIFCVCVVFLLILIRTTANLAVEH